MSYQPEPVTKVIRGGAVESVHYGSAAVVDSEGRLLYRVGDPYLITYMRSSAKPFQAIPLVESGGARAFGLTSAEIAITAGSHSGEEIHIKTVRSILDKIGLKPENLKCGVQTPIGIAEEDRSAKSKEDYTVLHHNCSGKHAGMLALAVYKNLPVDDYLSIDHPIQQLITRTIAEICCYPEAKIAVGIDGCSVPAHALPLYNMAWGFARFAAPNSVPMGRAKAIGTVSMAMMEYPEMVAGTGRFDTVLPRTEGERIVSKGGAEGLECFAFADRHWGASLKIVDGARRAIAPFATEFLYKVGVRSKNKDLVRFHIPKIKNWREVDVGYIEPSFELKEVEHE